MFGLAQKRLLEPWIWELRNLLCLRRHILKWLFFSVTGKDGLGGGVGDGGVDGDVVGSGGGGGFGGGCGGGVWGGGGGEGGGDDFDDIDSDGVMFEVVKAVAFNDQVVFVVMFMVLMVMIVVL